MEIILKKPFWDFSKVLYIQFR